MNVGNPHRVDRELGPDSCGTARGEAIERLAQWVREKRLAYREDVLEGLEQAPGSNAGLYRGENLGKRLIRIAS